MAWAEAWEDVEAEIVKVLEGVSITEPQSEIKRVYPDPPGSLTDLPCFVIYPSAKKSVRGSCLDALTLTVRLRLFVSDADLSQAAHIANAFGFAVITAFNKAITLAGTAEIIDGPNVEEAASFVFGGKQYTGADCLLTVTLIAAADYSG